MTVLAAPALPLHTAGKYVAAAYIVFVVVLLIYLGIMALRTGRTNRELDDLRRALAERRAAQELDSPADTPAAHRASMSQNPGARLAAADPRDASSSDPRNSADHGLRPRCPPSGPASSPSLIRRAPATHPGFETGSGQEPAL